MSHAVYAPLQGVFTLLPTAHVHNGASCLTRLAETLERHGIGRARLITGTTLATTTSLVERVCDDGADDGR